jgi:acetyl esterase/lipase/lysophospholipase L1-like esterase
MKRMKNWMGAALLMLLGGSLAQAQTARKLKLYNSADSASVMEVFLPEHPTGRAVVDCPGGGYFTLAMQHEGYDWVNFFNSRGIAYAVLTYRMPKGDRQIPLSDAYHAIATVRDSAAVWHVNPYDVGIMGFSAGGHLASSVSTHAPFASRPNFSILFYPVISMNPEESHRGSCEGFLGEGLQDEELVKDWSNFNAVCRHLTPPAILLMSADDDVVPPLTNGLKYYEAMRQMGIPCAVHIYPVGGHGWGYNDSFQYHDEVLQELSAWLDHLQAPKEEAIRVACIGNSITDGHGIDMSSLNAYPGQLQQLLGEGYQVRNFGRGARTLLNKGDFPYMQEEAWRQVLAFNPQIVVIKLGTNDSKPQNWQYGKEFQQDLQQMVDALKALPAQPKIFLATPITAYKPSWEITERVIADEIIPVIRKVAKKNKLEVIDLHELFKDEDGRQVMEDGIHPTQAGDGQIARYVKEAIQK